MTVRRRFAIVVLVVVAVAVGVLLGTDRGESKRLATTPEALAAATVRHVPEGLRLIRAQHSPDDDPATRMLVHLTYDAGGQQAVLDVEVHAKAKAPQAVYQACESAQSGSSISCEYRILPDGTKTAVLRIEEVLGVAVTQATGDLVIASVPSAAQAGPFSLDLLTDIAVDPLVALTTTQQMIDAGGAIHFT